MITIRHWLRSALSVSALAVLGLAWQSGNVAAKGEPKPEPVVDCGLKKNKTHPQCKKNREMSDDELYHAGYWLARKGDYAEAIMYLRRSQDMASPRVLTYIGFSLRKLGNWQEAMGYYDRALALDPAYVVARSYLGEAMLQRGDLARAKAELDAIERLCGTGCEEFTTLKGEIEAFEAARS